MTEELITILDHIDSITVKGNPFAEPANKYYALLSLRSGLEYIYDFAEKCDQIALKQLNPKKQYFIFGSSPLLNGIPYRLLACTFQWYSISACQYVRTIGNIAYRQDNSRPASLKYIESIIPEVKAFRDKVAAHFAWLTESAHDNDAERLASIIPQVAFCKGSFRVGALKVSKQGSSKSSTSKDIQPWSIVEIH